MSRFRFRLARVLRVRRLEEEVARGEWLAALVRARRAAQRAEGAAAEAGEARAELRRLRAEGPCPVADVLLGEGALERAQRTLRRGRERQATLERQAEAVRAPWEERRKAVRGLEHWRDRARERHARETAQKESALMDEISSARALRRGREARAEATPPADPRSSAS